MRRSASLSAPVLPTALLSRRVERRCLPGPLSWYALILVPAESTRAPRAPTPPMMYQPFSRHQLSVARSARFPTDIRPDSILRPHEYVASSRFDCRTAGAQIALRGSRPSSAAARPVLAQRLDAHFIRGQLVFADDQRVTGAALVGAPELRLESPPPPVAIEPGCPGTGPAQPLGRRETPRCALRRRRSTR